MCCKCERVYSRYGTDEISTDIDDPLEVFDATDVSKNVMRFVVYILWSKRQPNSFEGYLCVNYCGPGGEKARVSGKRQGSHKVENKTLFNVRSYADFYNV